MSKHIEAEGGELLIRSSNGYMAIIPKNMAEFIKEHIKSGNHAVVDNYVKGLKEMKDGSKAQDGGTIKPPTKSIAPAESTGNNFGMVAAQNFRMAQQNAEKERLYQKALEDKTGAAEEYFTKRYDTSPHRYKYDTDPQYRKEVDARAEETSKKFGSIDLPATDVNSRNYAGNPNLAFMTQKGMSKEGRKALEQSNLEIIGAALPVPGIETVGKLPSFASKAVNFAKYAMPREAALARAERMLAQEDKWRVNNPSYVKDKFSNISDNFEEILASDAAKKPTSLGVNSGGKAYSFKDAPLSEANKARIAAHETGHFYRNAEKEADEWNSFFDFSKLPHGTKKYLKGKPTATSLSDSKSVFKGLDIEKKGVPHGDEIRERAAQLKDYIAQKNGIPLNQDFIITKSQLDDAIKNYVKDTKLDNSMSAMLSSLVDKKGFLDAMNKYPLGIAMTVGAYKSQQEYGKE
jgi:hypothetical protein